MTEMIENCEIIVFCSSHMKRIVDDVLTISKLDGNLIVIIPVDVQPVVEIEKVIRLFKAEAENARVELKNLQITPRYHKYNVDIVKMDPVRLSQILSTLLVMLPNSHNSKKYVKLRSNWTPVSRSLQLH